MNTATPQQGLPEEWANLLPEGTTVQTAPPTVSPKHAKRNSHIAAPVRGDESDGVRVIAFRNPMYSIFL